MSVGCVRERADVRQYANLSGKSGVAAFECGDGFIVVEFVAKDADAERFYRYTAQSAGASTIATMQKLAATGRGLSTFIAQNAPNYESRYE